MKYLFPLMALVLPLTAAANDYPTLERVDHVLTCMRTNGGQNVDNLYACSCEIDIVAQQLSFEDFTEARTFEIYKRMPGEKGGLFRDSDRAKEVVGKLEQGPAPTPRSVASWAKKCRMPIRQKVNLKGGRRTACRARLRLPQAVPERASNACARARNGGAKAVAA